MLKSTYAGAVLALIGIVSFFVTGFFEIAEPGLDNAAWWYITGIILFSSNVFVQFSRWVLNGNFSHGPRYRYQAPRRRTFREPWIYKLDFDRISWVLTGCWLKPTDILGRMGGGWSGKVGFAYGRRGICLYMLFWSLIVKLNKPKKPSDKPSVLIHGNPKDQYITPVKDYSLKGGKVNEDIPEHQDYSRIDRMGFQKTEKAPVGLKATLSNIDEFKRSLHRTLDHELNPVQSRWARFRMWLTRIFHKLF